MNNKVSSYNDLSLLTKWIDNQRAFERHKKKLDDIYENLHKKSVTEFGFINKTFEELQHKIKTVSDLHKFMDKEKSIEIGKLNQILGNKITYIQKRENTFIKNQIDTSDRNKVLRKRIGILKSMENEKITKENEFMARRIIEKTPCVSMKKIDNEYQKTVYYKKYYQKFELPKIKVKGPVVIGRKLETGIFYRGKLTKSENFYTRTIEGKTLANAMKNISINSANVTDIKESSPHIEKSEQIYDKKLIEVNSND